VSVTTPLMSLSTTVQKGRLHVYLICWFLDRWWVLWVPVDGRSSADLVSTLRWIKCYRCCTTPLYICLFKSHEWV